MDEQVEKRIISKVSSLGYNYDDLKDSIKDYLIKVEATLMSKEKMKSECLEILKEKLSLSSIATDTQISRKTFYNNNILKEYIELDIENSTSYVASDSISLLKNRIKELEEMVEKMVCRDINYEQLKAENEQLADELKAARSENKRLSERNISLSKEIKALKAPVDSKVIVHPFSTEKQNN